MKIQHNRYRYWHMPVPMPLALALALALTLALVVTLVTMMTAYVVQAQEQSNQVYLPILFGDPAPSDSSLPDLVLAKQPSLHPEGVEWDAVNGRFLVGSLTQGTVFAVADDGTVTPFATSDNLAMGSVGIHIDKSTNRLLVAHSNPLVLGDAEVIGVAQLGIYDLATGEELHFVDLTALGALGGRFFANDVTSDADGNAYVTNSLSTVIYKVDIDGNAEVFVNNLGANGIDYHPDGYLLAAANQNPGLVKIPLDDPTALAPVTLSEPARMDGIILDANGELVAVAKTNFGADGSFEDEVLTFSSNDSWATATVSARGVAIPESAPTTVTLRDNNAYVVHAHFAELAAGVVVQEFEIQRVLFNEPAADPSITVGSESPQDAFLNEEQTDTTADSDLPTDSAELISAFFGLDNGLPLAANRGICEGAGNADGMPVIFSAEIDLETMQVGDFQVTTASGEIGSIECVTLAPAIDEGELRTVLLVGEFGSAEDDPPTSVEIIGNLHSIDQTINFKGATVAVTPLDPGPSMVFAEIVPGEMWNLGRESDGSWGSSNGCPAEGVVQIVRATWDGGVTLKDDEEITNANRDLYKVTVQSADGTTREVTPFALGDLGDGDNNHELCLDTSDRPLSVFFPAGILIDPNHDLNPETTIQVTY